MSYGYPAPPPGVQMPPRQSSNGLAIAGFVLCLISLAGSWIPILNLIPIGLAILGLILAGVGLAKSREVGNGRGLAIAGLVVGVLSIVVAVAVNVLTVYLIKDTVDEASRAIVVGPDGTTLTTSPEEPARLNSTISSAGFDTQITGVTSVESDVDGQVPTAGHVYLQVSLTSTLASYSRRALERVWKAQHFSYWMTTMLHTLPGATPFDVRRQEGELASVTGSVAGSTYLAEGYTGWPQER